MKEKLKNFKWGYLILALITAAIGVLSLTFNDMLPTVALCIGIVITLFGIGYGIFAIFGTRRGVGFAFKIVIAVCAIISGVVTMIFRSGAIETLTSLFGLFIIIDGSFKLYESAISRRFDGVAWWLMIVPAILSIIGGFFNVKIASNDDNATLISVLFGITMIVDAISNLIAAFCARIEPDED